MDRRHGHGRDGPLRGQGRRQGRGSGWAPRAWGQIRDQPPSSPRSSWASTRPDPDRHGRFRSRRRRWLDGLALGLYRRLGRAERQREARRQGQGAGRRRARGQRRRHRLRRRPFHHRRHRPRHRPGRVGRQAARQAHLSSRTSTRSTASPGPTAPMSARSRSIPTPASAVELKRYTTVDDVGQPAPADRVRPDPGRLRPGHRPGAARGECLRPAEKPASSSPASFWADYAMPRAATFPTFSNALDDSVRGPRNNPLGAKGVGESGAVGSTPTVMNAITWMRCGRWALRNVRVSVPATRARSGCGGRSGTAGARSCQRSTVLFASPAYREVVAHDDFQSARPRPGRGYAGRLAAIVRLSLRAGRLRPRFAPGRDDGNARLRTPYDEGAASDGGGYEVRDLR